MKMAGRTMEARTSGLNKGALSHHLFLDIYTVVELLRMSVNVKEAVNCVSK
jgi:hypothetical protein